MLGATGGIPVARAHCLDTTLRQPRRPLPLQHARWVKPAPRSPHPLASRVALLFPPEDRGLLWGAGAAASTSGAFPPSSPLDSSVFSCALMTQRDIPL